MGIAEEDIERIFAKFEQVNTTDARQQGTGLGLAISNRIVLMMGDRIRANSRLGHGSTFYFEIPLTIADAADKSPCADAEQVDFTGKRALVAEDNELNMEIIAYVLDDMGFTVDKTTNGQEAVDRLAERDVDLVLMDIMMPEKDGLAAMREIRAQRRLQDLPIIALTAKAMPDDRERCLQAGANDYIAKPIDVDKLVSLCRVWCSRQ